MLAVCESLSPYAGHRRGAFLELGDAGLVDERCNPSGASAGDARVRLVPRPERLMLKPVSGVVG